MTDEQIMAAQKAALKLCPCAIKTDEYHDGIGCTDRGVECDGFCREMRVIENVIKAGYGDLREFAEELKRQCEINSDAVGGCGGYCVNPADIRAILKEYLK